jgi:hypothetical protein
MMTDNNFTNADDNDLRLAAEQADERARLRRRAWKRLGNAVGTITLIGGIVALVGYGFYLMAKDENANFEYRFHGNIAGEQVYFHESWEGSINYLDVVQQNGTQLYFTDWNNDFKIDSLEIKTATTDAKYLSTSDNLKVKKIIENGQERFEAYLDKIIELNSAGLDINK